MLQLIGVSLLAGAATVLAPCVLPVLPVVMAGAAGSGRRGPIGIAVGLAVSFTVFTLTASRLLRAIGLPQDLLFHAAIALIALVGIAMFWPRLAEVAGRPFGPVARFTAMRLRAGDGLRGGLLLGLGLGLVWTPCAGPILGAIATLSARDRLSPELVAITVAYAAGSAGPVLLLALGGQRASDRLPWLRAHAPRLRQGAGVVLVGAAALFLTDIPTRLATASAGPALGVTDLERSQAVGRQLGKLTGAPRFVSPTVATAAATAAAPAPADTATAETSTTGAASSSPATVPEAAAPASDLPVLGQPPELTGIVSWLNTPQGAPLTLAGLRGRVVLIDFWTYSCINCLRTLPYLKAWDERYREEGLTIVGVHSPEFAFERVVGNVRSAVEGHGIRYPVAVDSDLATWSAWQNQYWPAEYLIDRDGNVRAASAGEGDYERKEAEIRELLGESVDGAPVAPADVIGVNRDLRTPETYLGAERGSSYDQKVLPGAPHDYGAAALPGEDQVHLAGPWQQQAERIVAGKGAELALRFAAERAYVVLTPPGSGSGTVEARVDDGPWRSLSVARHDLYQVADLTGAVRYHTVRLRFSSGVAAYAFTFG